MSEKIRVPMLGDRIVRFNGTEASVLHATHYFPVEQVYQVQDAMDRWAYVTARQGKWVQVVAP